MKLIDTIRAAYTKVRETQAKERLHDAVHKAAARAGDVAATRIMREHYATASSRIDPQVDWWGFAEAKQKHVDYEAELKIDLRKLEDAEAKVKAEKSRLEKMQ